MDAALRRPPHRLARPRPRLGDGGSVLTHEYTLLVGGTILPARGVEPCSAIAWAAGTVLALGTEAEVRAISRGDSEVFDLGGAYVVPLGPDDRVAWPPEASLEVGGPADLAILSTDPRRRHAASSPPVALVRGGHAVHGRLPPDSG